MQFTAANIRGGHYSRAVFIKLSMNWWAPQETLRKAGYVDVIIMLQNRAEAKTSTSRCFTHRVPFPRFLLPM